MPFAAEPPVINEAATAFMLIASSMVLLMTPGLALFYGGMTRSKSVLNMMMMSFGALAAVGIIYVLWGYSMSFGNLQDGTSDIAGIFANPFHLFGLSELTGPDGPRLIDPFGVGGVIPEYIYVGFQLTFAAITAALISGAIADRVKFSTWMTFVVIWVTIVYFPAGPHGVGRRRLSGSDTGLSARLRFDRRRRRRRCRSTSPVAQSCTSTPVPPASPLRSSSASASASARSPCARTTCRSS